MDFKVRLYASPTNSLEFNLVVTDCLPDIRMDYCDEAGFPFISDYLKDFHSVKMDDANPLLIYLCGVVSRTILFSSDLDYSNFCTFIKQAANVKASPDSDTSLLISRKEVDIVSFKRTHHSVPPMNLANCSNPTTFAFSTTSSSDFILLKPFSMTQSEVQSRILHKNSSSVLPFWAIEPESQTILEITSSFLAAKSDDYSKLRKQWSSISHWQWQHNLKLQSYVKALESFLQTNKEISEAKQKLIFGVCISLFFYRFYIKPSKSLFAIAEVFTDLFVKGASEDKVYLSSGEFTSFEDAESKIFFQFERFYAKFIDSLDDDYKFSKDEDNLDAAEKFLSTFSSETAEILSDYSSAELVKAVQSFKLCLAGQRPLGDVALLIAAMVSNSNPSVFLTCLLCSTFHQFLSFSKELSTPIRRPFQTLFEMLIERMNVRLVLYNAEKFQDFLAPYL